LYDDEGLLYKYVKENHSREILDIKTNSKEVISFSKKLGDKHFKWDNGLYELYSANQTALPVLVLLYINEFYQDRIGRHVT
jgi:hypothetical protein